MVENEKVDKDFVAYLDDDGQLKNQHVIIIKRDISGVEFKFNQNDTNTIFIPMYRVLKVKLKGEKNVSN